MTRLCVIGNSHAACFKLAWNTLSSRYSTTSLTFFAQRGAGMTQLVPSGDFLVPETERLAQAMAYTSGGLRVIDPTAYDAVLLIGFFWGYPPVPGYFSRAAASRALLDHLPRSPVSDLLLKIRTLSDIPVFVVHQPLRRQEGDNTADHDIGPYRKMVRLMNEEFLLKQGAMLLPQPAQTITNYFCTRTEFSIDSKRLDIGDLDSDGPELADPRSHMNERYGDIFLSTHLPTIASAQMPN